MMWLRNWFGGYSGNGYGNYGDYAGYAGTSGDIWFWMIIMMVIRLIIIAAVIYFIYRFFTGSCKGGKCLWGGSSHSGHGNALAILNERYAKGEIDEKEYKAKKKEISE